MRSGRWATLMGMTDYPTFARSMVRYFTRLEATHGDAWTSGRLAAEAWAALLATSEREASELIRCDELILCGASNTASAWIELTMFYEVWRGQAGMV